MLRLSFFLTKEEALAASLNTSHVKVKLEQSKKEIAHIEFKYISC